MLTSYILIGIVVIALIGIAVVIYFVLKKWLPYSTFEERKDFIDLYTKIIGSMVLVVSLLFTWWSTASTLRVSTETLLNSQQKDRADRFAKANEQLANPDEFIRASAAYSLGQLANDSDDYNWRVMQVLTDFIRARYSLPDEAKLNQANANQPNQSNINQGNANQANADQADANQANQSNVDQAKPDASRPSQLQPRTKCPVDLQAAMEVIAWRKSSFKIGNQGSEEQRLDLSHTDLRFVLLRSREIGVNNRQGAHLEGIRLTGANLENSNLRGAHLEEALLDETDLKNAYLQGVVVNSNTDFTKALVEGADLSGGKGFSLEKLQDAYDWCELKQAPQVPPEIFNAWKQCKPGLRR